MNDKSLERDIAQVEEELSNPVPDQPSPKQETKKVATKKTAGTAAGKKPAPSKAAKTSGKAAPAKTAKKTAAAADVEGMVKLKTLADEAKISTQRARQKLRGAELARDGRWAWKEGSRDLAAARKALGLSA